MSNLTKAQQAERADAIAKLREMLPPGTEVYTILRHVSRSGMMRHISLVIIKDGELVDITWRASKALDWPMSKDHAIKVGGCGMDTGFHLVHSLSYAIHGHDNHGGEGVTRSGYILLKHRWL